ncbi:MAG: hypothetical protein ACOC26_06835 [Halochromatium sp.]|uniref:hypothetical protein n=1 Tax=Halochromatium sp. TaxID=2049430 RepID=UPI00397949EC
MPVPLAGAGLFGLQIGIAVPVATLALYIIFGAVLDAVYGAPPHYVHGHAAVTSL